MEQTELKAERQGPQTALGTWHPYLPVPPLYVGSASWSFLAHAFGWVSLLAAFSSLALVSGLVFALCPRSWLAPPQQWATAFNRGPGSDPPSCSVGTTPFPVLSQAHLLHLSPWGKQP